MLIGPALLGRRARHGRGRRSRRDDRPRARGRGGAADHADRRDGRASICGLQTTDDAADPVRAVLTQADRSRADPGRGRSLRAARADRRRGRPRGRAACARASRRRTALDAALARSGIDEKHLRETLRQDLRIRAYLDQRFTAASDAVQALIDDWMAGLRRRGDVSTSTWNNATRRDLGTRPRGAAFRLGARRASVAAGSERRTVPAQA